MPDQTPKTETAYDSFLARLEQENGLADAPLDDAGEKAGEPGEGEDAQDAKPGEGEESGDDKAPEIDAKRLEAARKALLRDGTFDEDDLKDMDPARILAKGEKAASRQAEIDRRLRAPKEPDETPKPDGDTTADDGADLAMPEGLVDVLGDSGAKELSAYAMRLAQRQIERALAPLKERDSDLQQIRNAVEMFALERAFEKLEDEFPELKTEEGREKVTEAVRKTSGQSFKSVTDLVRFAAGGALGSQARQTRRTAEIEDKGARSRGQMTPPTTKPRAKTMTPDEATDAQLASLEKQHGVRTD